MPIPTVHIVAPIAGDIPGEYQKAARNQALVAESNARTQGLNQQNDFNRQNAPTLLQYNKQRVVQKKLDNLQHIALNNPQAAEQYAAQDPDTQQLGLSFQGYNDPQQMIQSWTTAGGQTIILDRRTGTSKIFQAGQAPRPVVRSQLDAPGGTPNDYVIGPDGTRTLVGPSVPKGVAPTKGITVDVLDENGNPVTKVIDPNFRGTVGPAAPKGAKRTGLTLGDIYRSKSSLTGHLGKNGGANDALIHEQLNRLDAAEAQLRGVPYTAPTPDPTPTATPETGASAYVKHLAGRALNALNPAPTTTPPATPEATPTAQPAVPPVNFKLNPGVTLNDSDEIYTDGKTIFRAPAGQGPTPDDIKNLGLTRVK